MRKRSTREKQCWRGALLEHDDDRNTVYGKTTLSTPNQSIKRNHLGGCHSPRRKAKRRPRQEKGNASAIRAAYGKAEDVRELAMEFLTIPLEWEGQAQRGGVRAEAGAVASPVPTQCGKGGRGAGTVSSTTRSLMQISSSLPPITFFFPFLLFLFDNHYVLSMYTAITVFRQPSIILI